METTKSFFPQYFEIELNITPEQIFKPLGVCLYGYNRLDINGQPTDSIHYGEMKLLNTVTGITEIATLWGDQVDDVYLCFPTGKFDEDEDEITEIVYIADFGLQLNDAGTSFI